MDDKLKIFWNLEILVKMSRSKNDGPSLRIEENEIEEKIKSYRQEIEEIESISEEENYDTSAEMADRNIEIITKKQIQVLRTRLKENNKELTALKIEEKSLYEKNNLLRENKSSQEKYIASMQERVNETVDSETLDRYNCLIAETTEKVNELRDNLERESGSYKEVQEKIIIVTNKINTIEEEIDKKKKLLSETQTNLENKDNYIDHSKTEKNAKRIGDLEAKIQKLTNRLEIIRKDPQYLESKIKDIINNKEPYKKAKPFLIELINQVIKVPYINVPTDNLLEEELLRATQARDSFANEIDQKTYNILEANTPEKVRIEFLTDRINKWKEQLETYNQRIDEIDHDKQFNYERKDRILNIMINSMKNDIVEFERAYDDIPDSNISGKASIKAALEEKKEDLTEAEKIATLFRKDEAEDIATATRTIKYECDQINKNIIQANDEIQKITNRLTSKKSGLIDISTRNKDKDILKELAQIVINIKHRRQFPDTPLEIIERLEEDLDINLKDNVDMYTIEETSTLIPKDYEEYYNINNYDIEEEQPVEIDIQIPEENDEDSSNEESVNRFEETYNRLIKGEEEIEDNGENDDGDETIGNFEYTPESTTEEDEIEQDIENFYGNEEYVSDHSEFEKQPETESVEETTYEEEPNTEEYVEQPENEEVYYEDKSSEYQEEPEYISEEPQTSEYEYQETSADSIDNIEYETSLEENNITNEATMENTIYEETPFVAELPNEEPAFEEQQETSPTEEVPANIVPENYEENIESSEISSIEQIPDENELQFVDNNEVTTNSDIIENIINTEPQNIQENNEYIELTPTAPEEYETYSEPEELSNMNAQSIGEEQYENTNYITATPVENVNNIEGYQENIEPTYEQIDSEYQTTIPTEEQLLSDTQPEQSIEYVENLDNIIENTSPEVINNDNIYEEENIENIDNQNS